MCISVLSDLISHRVTTQNVEEDENLGYGGLTSLWLGPLRDYGRTLAGCRV